MSEPTALVIGGTGPTGPSLVNGLLAQGLTTAILHTGRHEVDTMPPQVEHIHTNPFKINELAAAVGDRTFDIVYSMYGRLRDIAPWFVGKTGKFVAVGGMPSYLVRRSRSAVATGFARPHQGKCAAIWRSGKREDGEDGCQRRPRV